MRSTIRPPQSGHWGWLLSAAFCCCRTFSLALASASDDQTLRFWAMPHGELTHTLDAEGFVTELAVSPDGRHYAAGRLDGTVVLGWMPADWLPPGTLSLEMLRRGLSFDLLLRGPPNQSVRLQTSSDLGQWTDWTNATTGLGFQIFTLPTQPGPPRRFYRAVEND